MTADGDAGVSETQDSIAKSLQRHINCLLDDNKATRRRGLLEITKETIARKLGGTVLQSLSNQVLKPVLKCLADPSECNRELATGLVSKYIDALPSPEDVLHMTIPMLTQRLGQETITESAEELRFQILADVLMPCIVLCGKKISAYLGEIISILERTLVDPFAEVRKISCKIASKLAVTIPAYFHLQAENLVKPLMSSMTHQHSKVRIAVLEATCDVIQYGNGKTVEEVVPHLAQRFFDPSAQVRMTVTKVIGRWLHELPDRYSFFYKFIPLILTSFNDEFPDIRAEARRLWKSAGKLYEEENEQDMKDKLDFGQPIPKLYPKDEERPGLGCRELVHQNLSKLMNAIIRDLGDWVVETRVKTSQLLYQLLLHAEIYTTQHMQPLTQALLRACADDEVRVTKGAIKSCQLIGAFVEPQTFCKIIIPAVRSHPASPAGIQIISSAIRGCSDDVLGEHLDDIIALLADTDISQASEKATYHLALLDWCDSLMETCHPRIDVISYHVFLAVVTCLALTNQEKVQQECDKTLEKLAAKHKDDVTGLYQLHTKTVIDNMKDSYENWTFDSIDQLVFNCLLLKAGGLIVGDILEEVLPILKVNLDPTKEPQLRLKFFSLLSNLIMNCGDNEEWKKKFSDEHIETIVLDMISTNLTWKAGRVAGGVRSIAVATLWALLRSGMLRSGVTCVEIFYKILPSLKSMLQDDNKTARLLTSKVFRRFLNACGRKLEVDELHQMYIDLLQRMDDAGEEIRKIIADTWLQYFKCFPEKYDECFYKAHLQEMYSGLLVHMDDTDTELQLSVQAALKEGGRLSKELLKEEINKIKHKHRTPFYCEELIKHFTPSQNNASS